MATSRAPDSGNKGIKGKRGKKCKTSCSVWVGGEVLTAAREDRGERVEPKPMSSPLAANLSFL